MGQLGNNLVDTGGAVVLSCKFDTEDPTRITESEGAADGQLMGESPPARPEPPTDLRCGANACAVDCPRSFSEL